MITAPLFCHLPTQNTIEFKGWNGYFSIIAFVIAFGFLLPLHLKIIRSD